MHKKESKISYKSVQRTTKLDALKGFAILLVILGHSVQGSFINFDSNLLFRFIYSFHMPLFMFLSGYIAFGRPVKLNKKAIALLLPLFTWYLLGYLIPVFHNSAGIYQYLVRFLKSPDFGLWFLWVLFFNFLILWLLTLEGKLPIELKLGIAIFLLQYIPGSFMGINLIKWYFIFFSLGYLYVKYEVKIKCKKEIGLSSLVIFPLLVSHWRRKDFPDLTKILSSRILFMVSIYRLITPIFGIIFSFQIIDLIKNKSIYRYLCWLGYFSLEIYVTQQFIILLGLRYPHGINWTSTIVQFIMITIASVLFVIIARRVKLMNLLLFGKTRLTKNPYSSALLVKRVLES